LIRNGPISAQRIEFMEFNYGNILSTMWNSD
jgi:hypothetical protein